MTEYRDTPMRAFMREAYCDCGGKLRYSGDVFASNPPLYAHHCEGCDKKHNLRVAYPLTVYKREGEE